MSARREAAIAAWAEVMMDALRASDNGNNPFYSDDPDTVDLARELAEAAVTYLEGARGGASRPALPGPRLTDRSAP